MLGDYFNGWTSVLLVFAALFFLRLLQNLEKKALQNRFVSDAEWLWKMARAWECSEYDLFFVSTQDWRVSKAKIEDDFKKFLTIGIIPYYVRDFIRKNKEKIDKNYKPPFLVGIDMPATWIS